MLVPSLDEKKINCINLEGLQKKKTKPKVT